MARTAGMRHLLAMSAIGFAGFGLLLPTAPLWAAHGGADETGVGAVNAVFMAVTVLAQTGVHRALIRFGWRSVLICGLVLLGLPSLAFPVSDALAWILLLSAVRGTGFAVLTVCGASAVAELTDQSERGRAIGRYGLAIAVPQFLLVPSSAWIADTFAPWVIFVLGALPVLAVPFAAVLGGLLDGRPTAEDHDDDADGPRGPVLRRLLLPSLALLAVTAPGGALLSFTAQFSPDTRTTFFALLLFTGAASIARWRVGRLADRHGPFRLQPLFLTVGAAGLIGCALAIRGHGNSGALIGAMALVGVAYGSMQNLTLVAAFLRAGDRHHLASTVWNIGFDAGTGVGSLAVGAIASGASFGAALVCTAVLAAGVALATLRPALTRSRAG